MKKLRVVLSVFVFLFGLAGALASSSVFAEETVGGIQNDVHANCNKALDPVDVAIGCATNYFGQQCRLEGSLEQAYKSDGNNCVRAIMRKN